MDIRLVNGDKETERRAPAAEAAEAAEAAGAADGAVIEAALVAEEQDEEQKRLSDQEERFQLQGDAYVHGLMRVGEAFRAHGRGPERYFKLV